MCYVGRVFRDGAAPDGAAARTIAKPSGASQPDCDPAGGADGRRRRSHAMVRVFAFGTLKRGFPLHIRGLAGAVWLGECRTVTRFPLVVAGRWYAPMMFDRPGRGHRVAGELYEVDQVVLLRLDALESLGRPGCFRKQVTVEREDGTRCRAFAYMKSPALAVPLHGGYLADYQDRRFVPPERRGALQ